MTEKDIFQTDSNMKKLLITGAAGFIGSSLITKLLKAGNIVIGIDNLNDSYNPDWKIDNIKKNTHENFYFHKEDILNKSEIEQIIKKYIPSIILHLAARAGIRPSVEIPLLYQKVNIEGTLNMLEIARNYNVEKFIFASSSSVYGNNIKVPFSEEDPVDSPISPYAVTKIAAEMLVKTYSHLYKIPSISLRLFTVYGPGGRPDMAPFIFTESILSGLPIKKYGDGTSKRDYTYIDDIVDGILLALNYNTTYDVLNLGNSKPVSLNTFIQILEKISGKKAIINQLPMQAGDVFHTYADIKKAQKLLNYNPKVSLEEGLERFINWYLENQNTNNKKHTSFK